MEPFKNTDIPVLFVYMHVDEMVFRGMQNYKGKYKFINIETNYDDIAKENKGEQQSQNGIPEDDVTPFCLWVKNELQPVVNKVSLS